LEPSKEGVIRTLEGMGMVTAVNDTQVIIKLKDRIYECEAPLQQIEKARRLLNAEVQVGLLEKDGHCRLLRIDSLDTDISETSEKRSEKIHRQWGELLTELAK
jgi:hypothetical protein